MTNTLLGVLFLLGAVLIISLYSCNRNNTKSEKTNSTELKDTTIIKEDLADSELNKVDTLQVESAQTDSLQMDTTSVNTPSAKTVVHGEKIITDNEDEQKTESVSDKSQEATNQKLSLKENTSKPKPKTEKSSGLQSTGALKDKQDKDLSKRILIVGSGGGVTGAVNEYRIEVDGAVYEKKSLGDNASRKKGLQVDQIQKINQQFNELDIDNLKYNNPGNLYYFVGYEVNGKTHQITWGGTNDEVPEKIKAYYDFVMSELSK